MVIRNLALAASLSALFVRGQGGDGWQPNVDWFLPADDGYVAFGDSFAAGMGTGMTSSDSCRVGEYGYPKLLNYFKTGALDSQSYVCSGDTHTGLNRQISDWFSKNKDKEKTADVFTVSIGGNDLGFSSLVDSCLLWANPAHAKDDCQKTKDAAKAKLADKGPTSLHFNIKQALTRIFKLGKNDKAHIFLTGYVRFFTEDTDWCDKTTFHFYKPNHGGGNGPELTKDTRKELNQLVTDLNTYLSEIVDEINKDYDPAQKAVFVDPNKNFDSHRFCSKDGDKEVEEPKEDRAATWFFLSSWKDIGLREPGSSDAGWNDGPSEQALNDELKQILEKGKIELPDAATCNDGIGDIDPVARWRCSLAKGAAVEGSDAQKKLDAANQEIKDIQGKSVGDIQVKHISWFYLTRHIKTFHPRSAGHWQGYLHALHDAMNDFPGITQEQIDKIKPHSIFVPDGSTHHSQGAPPTDSRVKKRGMPTSWWA